MIDRKQAAMAEMKAQAYLRTYYDQRAEQRGIPATTVQTVSVPQNYRVKVRYSAKVHGRYVWKYRYVTKTRYVSQQQTVTNPVITNIVAGAEAFRHDQPYPYNAGTC